MSHHAGLPRCGLVEGPAPPPCSRIGFVPARLLWLLALLAMAACGSARRSEPILGGLLPMTPRVEQGRVVFTRFCHHCHPGGEAGLAPAINDKPLPFLKRFQVRHGLGAMPAFSRDVISDEELAALVEYLGVLRRGPVEAPGASPDKP
jgi:mono/diheme cytochrome c family protein